MIDSPTILRTEARHTAVIHLTIPRSEIQQVMGPGIKEVQDALRAQGVEPAGRWFTRHFKMQPDVFDFEVGVPVHAPVTEQGRVKNSELPAARVARTIYRGGYEGLGSAWGDFGSWITENGHVADPSLWETYLVDHSSGPDGSKYETELTRPIAD